MSDPADPNRISLAYSVDADDAFMFYALTAGKVKIPGVAVEHVLEDIESLNRRARTAELEVTAVSAATYALIADRYHVHQMEIVAPHISPETSYVRDLKARLDCAHSHLVNIPVDIKELGHAGGLSDTDAKVREKAISACTKWIDVAHELGARSGKMMVPYLADPNTGTEMFESVDIVAYLLRTYAI
jgi:L-rhamnose isomerase